MAQLAQDWGQRGTRKGTTQKNKDLNWDKSIINLAGKLSLRVTQFHRYLTTFMKVLKFFISLILGSKQHFS